MPQYDNDADAALADLDELLEAGEISQIDLLPFFDPVIA